MSEAPRPRKKEAPQWLRCDYEVADVTAFQALERGDATEEQQKRALDWLIKVGAGMYEFHYHASDRDTAFALGRGFVGQQVVKLLRLNTMNMRRV